MRACLRAVRNVRGIRVGQRAPSESTTGLLSYVIGPSHTAKSPARGVVLLLVDRYATTARTPRLAPSRVDFPSVPPAPRFGSPFLPLLALPRNSRLFRQGRIRGEDRWKLFVKYLSTGDSRLFNIFGRMTGEISTFLGNDDNYLSF